MILSILFPPKKDINKTRMLIAAHGTVIHALGYCIRDILQSDEMSIEQWEQTQDPALVEAAKNYVERFLEQEKFSDLSANEEQYVIQTEWPLFIVDTLLIKYGVPEKQLPINNIAETLGRKSEAFIENLSNVIDRFHKVIVSFLGKDESTLSYALIVAAVEKAEDENMIDGEAFSEWFPRAVALLSDQEYKDTFENWSPT